MCLIWLQDRLIWLELFCVGVAEFTRYSRTSFRRHEDG